MNGENRGPWYLLTGLVIGVSLGLLYAWVFQPVKYVDTSPDSLRADFKDQHRALIAAAYLGNSDLLRARARLELLQDADMFRALTEQAQRSLAQQGANGDARALGLLAIALGQAPPGPGIAITRQQFTPLPQPTRTSGVIPPLETSSSDAASPSAAGLALSPSPTPPPTFTPTILAPLTETLAPTSTPLLAPTSAGSPTARPSDTPAPLPTHTATPGGPFVLLSQEKICDQPLSAPQLQIEALDRFNRQVPGVLVIVSWPGGQERFYTGLKPEKGLGYADYTLAEGTLYSVRLGENGQLVTDLAGAMCVPASGAPYWGAWRLKFVQP